jgi:hypothetical protein
MSTRCATNGDVGTGGDKATKVLSLPTPITTIRTTTKKFAFKPKYSMHNFKGSLEGGGKKGKDGSLVLAYGSQQPTKKPRANKVRKMHFRFDTISETLY